LGLGVAGLARDGRKIYALVALLISGALVVYFLVASGILTCTR
jgi:hypothetical protein